ncbi:MAG: hypothetical protein NTV94_01915 [Planctomycetota bacterium]|nr:hypothetical protein [Planctomycetota bacterium]
MSEQHTSSANGQKAMQSVLGALASIRLRARLVLLLQRSCRIAAAVVGAILILALLDYLLGLPSFLRLGHWCVGLVATGVLLWHRLVPAARFAPSLTDVALRVERAVGTTQPGLNGLLASGVDFARAAEQPQGPRAELLSQVQLHASEQYAKIASRASIFRLDGLWQSMAMVVLAAAPIFGLFAASPMYARIGLERTIAPWSDASWPKRTAVVPGDTPKAFPLGTALPVRAVLTATDRSIGQTQVMLYYKVSASGQTSPTRRTPMTSQSKRVNTGLADEGELFERLLDPDSITLPGLEASAAVTLEYWFETNDDQSVHSTVSVVAPPAVVAAKAVVTPPPYAAAIISASQSTAGGHRDWISGDWDATPKGPNRGLIGPVLSGSRIDMELTLNKDVPGLDAKATPESQRAFLAKALPGSEEAPDVSIITAGSTWRLSFAPKASMRIVAMLRDEYGISATDDAAFKLEVADDRPPAAAIIEPPQDEAVLPTAQIGVSAEGRDDVAIADLVLTQQLARVARGDGASPGATAEPEGDAAVIATAAGKAPEPGVAAATTLTTTASIDLAALKLEPGDEVWLVARARDLLLAGSNANGIESPRRRLRIIAESELIEQVRAELSGLREAAKRAESEQSKLAGQRDAAQQSAKTAAGQLSRQQSLSERLAPMQEVVKRLEKRAERNQLNDEALRGVLNDALELTKESAEQSGKAADALDRLAQEQAERAKSAADDGAALKAAQEKVEASLSELANMLDRGQDDWAVRRSIEKLLTQQQQLEARTTTGAQAMQGKAAEELTADQKAELERLAAEQMDLSQKAQAMVSSVQDRAGQMQKADAAQAQAMQAAANKARSEQLARKQEEASKQIAQNKTGEAQRLQQEASKTLSSMLEELDKTQQRKDEALRRVLANVQQSIQKLIDQQQDQITLLAAAMAGKPSPALDAGMIGLHQNTLGVQTSVKDQVPRGADHLLTLLGAAGEAQSGAITALRAVPADQPEADTNERTSMTRLKEALTEAQRLDEAAEEREEDRKRAELKKQYVELLEGQVAVNAEALPMAGKAPDRRQRAAARALGAREEQLRERMSAIRSESTEIAEAALFDFAHRRFDAAAGSAARNLSEGSTPANLSSDLSSAAKILQGLVAALDEAQKKKDEFKEDEEDGGGGGGGEGGQQGGKKPAIPPIAELKLLRAMQAEAADQTRGLGEGQAAQTDLTAVSTLQQELAKFAAELLEKIKKENEDQQAPTKERQ